MEKTRLQKLLAVLLAGGIALTSSTAMAKKKESAASAKPAKTIEEEVKAPSIDDLCLPEKCIAFLNQNNIQIVDGNIVIENVNQLILIRDYFIKDLKSKGIKVDDKVKDKKVLTTVDVMDYILNLNFASISEDIKIYLAENGLITMPVYTCEKNKGVTKLMSRKLGELALNCDVSGFVSNLPIIFDLKTRQCVSLAEEYLKKYISFKDKGDNDACYEGYITAFDDYYNFLMGKDSSFPYNISELDETAQYVFYIVTFEQQIAASIGGGAGHSGLLKSFSAEDAYTKVYPSIAKYVDNFPYTNEKVAKKEK